MAMLESEFFAAAAIHAGAVSSDYLSVFDAATRKIPMAIYIGTRDQFYPIDVVRGVHGALEKRGFDLLYKEMPDHDHNYKAVAGEINKEIWDFFAGHPLPADPRYTNYDRDPLAAANMSRTRRESLAGSRTCPPARPIGRSPRHTVDH